MHDQNSEVIAPAESLRDPASAMNPDPRTSMFVGQSPLSLTSHHSAIAAIKLSRDVPVNVAIQFETARNLYLYAWYVYRFYMVAAAQALSTLEFGLRERLPSRLPEPYQRVRQGNATLAGLLGYAIDQGLIRNEGFRRWHESAEHKARQRRSMEAMRTMIDQQLESMEIDETDLPEITPEDQCWDLVGVLRESLPRTRNELAHGSSMLTRQVLGTIELVAEILGQLYPDHEPVRT